MNLKALAAIARSPDPAVAIRAAEVPARASAYRGTLVCWTSSLGRSVVGLAASSLAGQPLARCLAAGEALNLADGKDSVIATMAAGMASFARSG